MALNAYSFCHIQKKCGTESLKGLNRSQLDNRVASAGLGFSRVVGGSCDRSGLFRTYGPLSNSDIAFYSEDWPEIQLRSFVEFSDDWRYRL